MARDAGEGPEVFKTEEAQRKAVQMANFSFGTEAFLSKYLSPAAYTAAREYLPAVKNNADANTLAKIVKGLSFEDLTKVQYLAEYCVELKPGVWAVPKGKPAEYKDEVAAHLEKQKPSEQKREREFKPATPVKVAEAPKVTREVTRDVYAVPIEVNAEYQNYRFDTVVPAAGITAAQATQKAMEKLSQIANAGPALLSDALSRGEISNVTAGGGLNAAKAGVYTSSESRETFVKALDVALNKGAGPGETALKIGTPEKAEQKVPKTYEHPVAIEMSLGMKYSFIITTTTSELNDTRTNEMLKDIKKAGAAGIAVVSALIQNGIISEIKFTDQMGRTTADISLQTFTEQLQKAPRLRQVSS